jgi:predicted transcriptional regulator
MVNGKNTVAQIAQRSGLGEGRTGEIISELLSSGLIEERPESEEPE